MEDVIRMMSEYLGPKELLRLCCTCRLGRTSWLTYELAINAILCHGSDHQVRTLESTMELFRRGRIWQPSPWRLLRLVVGRRCEAGCLGWRVKSGAHGAEESAASNEDGHVIQFGEKCDVESKTVRIHFGVQLCAKCYEMYTEKVPWWRISDDRAQNLDYMSSYIRHLFDDARTHRALAVAPPSSNFGARPVVWAFDTWAFGGQFSKVSGHERVGPIVTEELIGRLEPVIQRGKNIIPFYDSDKAKRIRYTRAQVVLAERLVGLRGDNEDDVDPEPLETRKSATDSGSVKAPDEEDESADPSSTGSTSSSTTLAAPTRKSSETVMKEEWDSSCFCAVCTEDPENPSGLICPNSLSNPPPKPRKQYKSFGEALDAYLVAEEVRNPAVSAHTSPNAVRLLKWYDKYRPLAGSYRQLINERINEARLSRSTAKKTKLDALKDKIVQTALTGTGLPPAPVQPPPKPIATSSAPKRERRCKAAPAPAPAPVLPFLSAVDPNGPDLPVSSKAHVEGSRLFKTLTSTMESAPSSVRPIHTRFVARLLRKAFGGLPPNASEAMAEFPLLNKGLKAVFLDHQTSWVVNDGSDDVNAAPVQDQVQSPSTDDATVVAHINNLLSVLAPGLQPPPGTQFAPAAASTSGAAQAGPPPTVNLDAEYDVVRMGVSPEVELAYAVCLYATSLPMALLFRAGSHLSTDHFWALDAEKQNEQPQRTASWVTGRSRNDALCLHQMRAWTAVDAFRRRWAGLAGGNERRLERSGMYNLTKMSRVVNEFVSLSADATSARYGNDVVPQPMVGPEDEEPPAELTVKRGPTCLPFNLFRESQLMRSFQRETQQLRMEVRWKHQQELKEAENEGRKRKRKRTHHIDSMTVDRLDELMRLQPLLETWVGRKREELLRMPAMVEEDLRVCLEEVGKLLDAIDCMVKDVQVVEDPLLRNHIWWYLYRKHASGSDGGGMMGFDFDDESESDVFSVESAWDPFGGASPDSADAVADAAADEIANMANAMANQIANASANASANEMANASANASANEMANASADAMADEMADAMAAEMANEMAIASPNSVAIASPNAMADEVANNKAEETVNETANASADASVDAQAASPEVEIAVASPEDAPLLPPSPAPPAPAPPPADDAPPPNPPTPNCAWMPFQVALYLFRGAWREPSMWREIVNGMEAVRAEAGHVEGSVDEADGDETPGGPDGGDGGKGKRKRVEEPAVLAGPSRKKGRVSGRAKPVEAASKAAVTGKGKGKVVDVPDEPAGGSSSAPRSRERPPQTAEREAEVVAARRRRRREQAQGLLLQAIERVTKDNIDSGMYGFGLHFGMPFGMMASILAAPYFSLQFGGPDYF
ncbi:hypothetical protein HDU96_009759 [Phlyctochytrium bullatum]|nr:hypothetical protein HDU96_009759 [Phlyctochytrium bullatum]